MFDEWLPLWTHSTSDNFNTLHDGYYIKIHDSAEKPFTIRGTSGRILNATLPSHNGMMRPTFCIDYKDYSTLHIMLASAFPNVVPSETVDHIDSNPKNNHITNLRWLSWADNSRRWVDGVQQRRNGKQVEMIDQDSRSVAARFPSISQAAEWIQGNNKLVVGTSKTVEAKITRAVKSWARTADGMKPLKAYGYAWRQSDVEDVADELWVQLTAQDIADLMANETAVPDNSTVVHVSNMGRIRTRDGVTLGQPLRGVCHKHRCVNLFAQHVRVNRLVYYAFHGNIPPNMCIMHKGHILDDEGCFINRLDDLELATRSDVNAEARRTKQVANNVSGAPQAPPALSTRQPDIMPDVAQASCKTVHKPTFSLEDSHGVMEKDGMRFIYDIKHHETLSKLNWDACPAASINVRILKDRVPGLAAHPLLDGRTRIGLRPLIYHVLESNPCIEGFRLSSIDNPLDFRMANMKYIVMKKRGAAKEPATTVTQA